jgi:hypothetical protein
LYQNKFVIQVIILLVLLVIFYVIIEFIWRIKQSKKIQEKHKQKNTRTYFNFNKTEKELIKAHCNISLSRSMVTAMYSSSSNLGLGINLFVRAGKNINYREVKPDINFVEQNINNATIILTTQRTLIFSDKYGFALRHLNLLGISFDEAGKSIKIIISQKGQIIVKFQQELDYYEFQVILLEKSYLKGRLVQSGDEIYE